MQKPLRGDFINLRDLFSLLLSRWYYFAIALVLALAAATAYLRLASKVYEVRASLLLDNKSSNYSPEDKLGKSLQMFNPNNELEDEIGLLTSTDMIAKTLQYLDFGVTYYSEGQFTNVEEYGNFAFVIRLDSASQQLANVPVSVQLLSETRFRIKVEADKAERYDPRKQQTVGQSLAKVVINAEGTVGQSYKDQYLAFTLTLNPNWRDFAKKKLSFVINDQIALAEQYQGKLKAVPRDKTKSNIVELTARGGNINKEVRFMNELLRVYMQNEADKKTQLAEEMFAFINRQASNSNDSLQRAEEAYKNVRDRYKVIDVGTTSSQLTMKMDALEQEQSGILRRYQYLKSIQAYLATANDVVGVAAPSSADINDPALSGLISELARLNQKMSSMQLDAKKENPVRQQLEQQITSTRQSLISTIDNLIRKSEIDMADVERRRGNIQGNINSLPQNEQALMNVKRKVDFNSQTYNYLLEKKIEVGIALAAKKVNKTVIDQAKPTSRYPVSPKASLVYLLAMLGGLMLPLGLIGAGSFLNNKIVGQDDIAQVTDIPVVGVIQKKPKKSAYLIDNNPKSGMTESFRSVRINLEYLVMESGSRVIGVTSSIGGEGKTFCASNLGVALAQSGKQVIVIDTDFRKPKLAEGFGVSNDVGLANYLNESVTSLKDLIQPSGKPNLDIIAAGVVPDNPADLLSNDRLKQLIGKLKPAYDFIVLDTAPLGLVSDYLILMRHTDYTLYVVRHQYTPNQALNRINQLYNDKKLTAVSILINDVDAVKAYGYNDNKSYGFVEK